MSKQVIGTLLVLTVLIAWILRGGQQDRPADQGTKASKPPQIQDVASPLETSIARGEAGSLGTPVESALSGVEPYSDKGTLICQVLDSETGAEVGNAEISLTKVREAGIGPRGPFIKARTDPFGKAEFEVPSGKWSVSLKYPLPGAHDEVKKTRAYRIFGVVDIFQGKEEYFVIRHNEGRRISGAIQCTTDPQHTGVLISIRKAETKEVVANASLMEDSWYLTQEKIEQAMLENGDAFDSILPEEGPRHGLFRISGLEPGLYELQASLSTPTLIPDENLWMMTVDLREKNQYIGVIALSIGELLGKPGTTWKDASD